jgi:hypothetical protein
MVLRSYWQANEADVYLSGFMAWFILLPGPAKRRMAPFTAPGSIIRCAFWGSIRW